MTRITLPSAALAAALDAVRFAAAAEPSPAACVLFEAGAGELTLVATDRFRLAVASAPAEAEGPPIRLPLTLPFVDELRTLTGRLVLDLAEDGVRAEGGGKLLEGKPLAFDFPDHRRLVGQSDPNRLVTVDTAALRGLVTTTAGAKREHEGAAYEVSILKIDPAGSVRLAAESEWAADAAGHIAVNREFLLQALDAGGSGQLLLELDGPIKPLAFRVPGDESRFSILMPVRE
jgi:DNA polymerase-3 subunit beta